MKTIFIMYVALVGAEYEYDAALRFYDRDICERAALLFVEAQPQYHAFCQKDFIITQPDGSVRPVARQ